MQVPVYEHVCNGCGRTIWTHRDCDKTAHMPPLNCRPDLIGCNGHLKFVGALTETEAFRVGATIHSAARIMPGV